MIKTLTFPDDIKDFFKTTAFLLQLVFVLLLSLQQEKPTWFAVFYFYHGPAT
jgi:hypothetical protein